MYYFFEKTLSIGLPSVVLPLLEKKLWVQVKVNTLFRAHIPLMGEIAVIRFRRVHDPNVRCWMQRRVLPLLS